MSQSKTLVNIKRLYSFFQISKANLWFFALSILCSFCFTLLSMYTILLLFPLSRAIIDNDFSHTPLIFGISQLIKIFPFLNSPSINLFTLLLLWIYVITIVKNIFYYLAIFSTQYQAKIAVAKLRNLLIRKCLSYEKNFYDKYRIPHLQSILTKSTTSIESQFKLLQGLFTHTLLLAGYLIIMFNISWELTLMMGATLPLINALIQWLTRKIRVISLEYHQFSANLKDKIFNMLFCMPVIKSFVKEDEEIQKFSALSDQEIEQSFKMQRLSSLLTPIEDTGMITGVLFLAMGIATFIHTGHALDPSKTLIIFYLATKILPSLNALDRFKIDVAKIETPLDEINDILNQDASATVKNGSEIFKGMKENIEFKNLSFAYADNPLQVLNQVTCSVKKGSVVAVVGPSGSGKSTLMKLLLRFYDCPANSIFIDGKDIKEYDIPSLRKHIGYVSQDVILFNDSIRHNILYGCTSKVSDEYFMDLCAKLTIADFVDKLPEKYDTSVKERGLRFSRGERQKISLARAIIKPSEILMMDEATSSLDSLTESKINESLCALCKEKTLLIIAHRLSTIKKADKIIYLNQGRVEEEGSFQELIDQKGLFYQQWKAQHIGHGS